MKRTSVPRSKVAPMRCLTLTAPHSLVLTDRPRPQPAEDEVLLQVSHCALCRTDAKMWQQGHRDLLLPRVLGHEFCGSAVGTGRRFVVWPGRACGQCDDCLQGRENLCPSMRILGFHRDGGLAEFVTVPASALIPISDDLDPAVACLAEPLACSLNGLARVRVQEGERVLIVGGGTLGILLALGAVSRGARVCVVDRNPSKLHRSRILRQGMGIEGAVEVSGPPRFHAAFNAAPGALILPAALSMLRPGGRLCLFSGITDPATLQGSWVNEVHYRELTVSGAYGCTRENMTHAVELLLAHGELVNLLVERTISLDQVESVFPSILAGDGFKFVVKMETPGKGLPEHGGSQPLRYKKGNHGNGNAIA